jgi:hypothetical protein
MVILTDLKIMEDCDESEHWLVNFKICCFMTNDDFKMTTSSNIAGVGRQRCWVGGYSSSLISKLRRTVMKANTVWSNLEFVVVWQMTTSTDSYFMKLICFWQYFVRLQKTLTAFKAICSIKSLIKQLRYQIQIEKIWSQMKSGKKRQESRASSEKREAKKATFSRGDCREKISSPGKAQRSIGKKTCWS